MLKCALRTCLCITLFQIFGRIGAEDHDAVVQSNAEGFAQLPCPFSTEPKYLARVTWTIDTIDGPEKILDVTECQGADIFTCQITHIVDQGKYAVEGSLSTGVTLVINSVALEDDGIYRCKAILQNGLVEQSIRLAVTYPPKNILIKDVNKDAVVADMSTLHALIDRPYNLSCTVPSPCNPPANISWSVGDVHAVVFQQFNHTSAEGAPLVTSSKLVQLTVSEEDTGKTISCTAMHYGLTESLQMNATLEVGRLPESPSGSDNWISSVTVDSFVVTWLQRSSGGKPQTFTVTYCEVLNQDECSEISGIGQTRTRIDNLRPFTLYRVTVKSHTVYGFSENNVAVEQSTRPLSPEELGVEGVHNSQFGRIDITRPNNVSGLLPAGLCFQLVHQSFNPSADTSGAASEDCVDVGEYINIPSGQSWTKMALVTYGNSVYSSSSLITGTGTGNNLALIVGASVGGSVFLFILFIIIFCKTRGRSSPTTGAHRHLPPQPQQARQIQVVDGFDPPVYSGVKYQEVNDPPAILVGPLGDMYATHHSYHDAQHDEQTRNTPKPTYGNGQYYSRNITMDKKNDERYGYMDPIE